MSNERLSSADVSFFYVEERTTPQHVGQVAVLVPPADGLDYDRLVRLLEERISLVPRYRQKVRQIPGHIANPVWVDDQGFDITYHVRRSALPRPGTDAQLLEFCARIQSRLLDPARPLWEMYLVEGLAEGRVAIVSKTHQALVDGVRAVDLAQVILDTAPEPRRTVAPLWMPEPEPSSAVLVAEAVAELTRRPAALRDAARLGMRDVGSTVNRLGASLRGAVATVAAVLRSPPASPLTVTLGQQRRIAIARTRLEDYRQVRHAHGGTVNDVVLATVTGALRSWLVHRGETVSPTQSIRALVPVSVTPEKGPADALAGTVKALPIDLPVGEPDPVRRLAHIAFAMAAHNRSGGSVSADALSALSGFAPPTLHALGARAVSGLTRRLFALVITNVPGPQVPLYAAGARMTEMFPILPLGPGQAVSIGLTSYDGGVYFGLNGDRDAMPDLDHLASLIEESLADLVAASPRRAKTAAAEAMRALRTRPGRRNTPGRAPGEPPR